MGQAPFRGFAGREGVWTMKLQFGRSTRRSLLALTGLTIAAGFSLSPVWAQVEPAAPTAPGAALAQPGVMPPGGGMMIGSFGGGAVAASGDSVYVARGGIVYRLRAS